MQKTKNVDELKAIARKVRRDIIQMITAAKSGHPGGSLSAVEILTTLFFDVMNHDPAHPDWKDRDRFIPSLEASTGSLGEGLSLAIGMALAARLNNSPSRTFVVLGDGEIQEGQIWEAAMFAPFHKVDNLVAIVDYNKIQLDGFVKDIQALEPLVDKWKSFGWHVIDLDGHSISALQAAFAEAAATKGK